MVSGIQGFGFITKSSKLSACRAGLLFCSERVQLVGGRGSEVGVGGSIPFAIAKCGPGLELRLGGVTERPLPVIMALGSDLHLCC